MKLLTMNPVYHVNAVDRLLNDFFSQNYQTDRFDRKELTNQPATNLYDQEDHVAIELSVPGYEKEQIKISVEKDLLIIKGEVENEGNQKVTYARVEFKPGNFEKKFKLSEKLDPEKINAGFKNGILKVTVSKKEEEQLQTRQIEIA
ncbi:Hsp20/alpha crystallin family protein [Gaoshiqia sp. Z1-71]|uniref:Hsp20/alpha crystallin family protein n=1 Tax=Gaoshiqia hydrogeniformans TaxID=3290090 RepID=UPI003BF9084D